MDDIGGIVLILAAIYVIVKIVIPIVLAVSAVVFAGFAAVGAIIGLFMAIKNFVAAISEINARRSRMGKLKNETPQHDVDMKIASGVTYEELAAKSYFFGPCFEDIGLIIKYSFVNNFNSLPDFGRGEMWLTRILFVVLSVVQLIVTYVFGTAFTLAICLLMLVLFLAFEIIFLIISGIVLVFENLYFSSRHISFRCPACKYEYKIPVYECPICHIKHKKLKPGTYGIFKRKCICGAVLPVSVRAKGYCMVKTPGLGEYTKKVIKFEDIQGYCSHCGAAHNAGISKPTSIALIGGASAGKTTFKVAFINDFLENELTKIGVDFEFPDTSDEREYIDALEYYKGRRIIPSTNRGISTDISVFSFFLKHKKFNATRMVHIYDMPGETFETGNAKEGWENYTFTEGAVFLIDPYSIPFVKNQQAVEVSSSSMGICTMHMDKLIESLIDTLRQVKVKKRGGKFSIPIALTINKADSHFMKNLCGDPAVKKLMEGRPDIFKDYYMAMDYACRCFLAKYGGMGFIATLDNHFETVHFFSSSPMGYMPKSSCMRFSPINVLPIMQWMMLRADKQLGKVWKPDLIVIDLTDEQKKLYREHPEYYDEFVLSGFDLVTV